MRPFSGGRRALLARLLVAAAGVSCRAARAEVQGLGDRGLGGTGAAPADDPGEDRGIGGTGYVGRIRRFGSVVVNGDRIGYPPDVTVTLDGAPASVRDLRVGQVVALVAHGRPGGLATREIAVVHEVVGPVRATVRHGLEVMGQTVLVPRSFAIGRSAVGDWVAVSGLRRLDGAIVASRIDRRQPGDACVAGIVESGPAESPHIGALPLAGLDPSLAGQRVAVQGDFAGGTFTVRRVTPVAADLLARRPVRLSVEAYVARGRKSLASASGFAFGANFAGRRAKIPASLPAILTARVGPDGRLTLEGLRVEHGRDDDAGRDGRAERGDGGRGGPTRGDPGRNSGARPGAGDAETTGRSRGDGPDGADGAGPSRSGSPSGPAGGSGAGASEGGRSGGRSGSNGSGRH